MHQFVTQYFNTTSIARNINIFPEINIVTQRNAVHIAKNPERHAPLSYASTTQHILTKVFRIEFAFISRQCATTILGCMYILIKKVPKRRSNCSVRELPT